MEQILSIRNLCKQYPAFRLQGVSFAVEKGMIMGFIGRNGAGKTTTLKSILNLVHPDSGEIRFWHGNGKEGAGDQAADWLCRRGCQLLSPKKDQGDYPQDQNVLS